ncbi:MAG: hypothetical protein JNM90_17555 [Burkholderiales bacterium]|nr:hypothetical protein [Burkholderiales bacterium]
MRANSSIRHPAPAAGSDQAAGLRSLLRRRTLRVLPVLGDRDAAAQGACAAQLAIAFGHAGRRVVLIDAAGGALAALGIAPRADLPAMVRGEIAFAEVATPLAAGVRAIAACDGLSTVLGDDPGGTEFFTGFLRLDAPAELIVLNLPAEPPVPNGHWLPLIDDSAEALLVMGVREESLTAAYATAKQAWARPPSPPPSFRVLVNGADGEREARAASRKLADAARRFLGAAVGYCGNVPRSARGQMVRSGATAHAEATRAFARIAADAQGWRMATCMLDESIATPTH